MKEVLRQGPPVRARVLTGRQAPTRRRFVGGRECRRACREAKVTPSGVYAPTQTDHGRRQSHPAGPGGSGHGQLCLYKLNSRLKRILAIFVATFKNVKVQTSLRWYVRYYGRRWIRRNWIRRQEESWTWKHINPGDLTDLTPVRARTRRYRKREPETVWS